MFQLRPLPRTLSAALRDLTDSKTHVRRSAISDLSRLTNGDDRGAALEGLEKALSQDTDENVRADAALALTDCEARSALPALVAAASDPHARVRQMALMALGELSPRGHKESCAVIEQALVASEPALRFQALIAAGRHRLPALESHLSRATEDADSKVRYLALRLWEERWQEDDPSATVLATVERALKDKDRTVAVAAAILLGPRGSELAARVLVDALNRGLPLPAPEDEQAIIELAGELGLAGAMPGLRRHAWGRFGLVPGRFFWQARVVLARLGDEKARKEIIRGLRGWTRDARTLASVAAGRAGLQEAKPILEELAREQAAEPEALSEALALLRQEGIDP